MSHLIEATHFYTNAGAILGYLWAGEDGRTIQQEKIKPGQSRGVAVKFSNATHLTQTLFSGKGVILDAHTSSRVVQHGIVVDKDHAKKVFSALPSDPTLPTVTDEFKMSNQTERDIILPKNTAVFNEYLWNGQTLSGDALTQQVNTGIGGIKITGEEGINWMWSGNDKKEADGILFKLNEDPKERLWLPHDDTPLVLVADKRHDFRASIDEALTPFSERPPHQEKESDETTLWVVGTNSKITLSPRIHAVIPNGPETSVVDPHNQLTANDGQQNSPLLIGGRTDWRARLEIRSHTDEDRIPNYILIQFTQAAKLMVAQAKLTQKFK